jgi:hypothetical protein
MATDGCELLGVKHSPAFPLEVETRADDIKFYEAISKSPHSAVVWKAPNPGLILALQGDKPDCPLYNGPVRVRSVQELNQVKAANGRRRLAQLPHIVFIKDIPSNEPVIPNVAVSAPTVASCLTLPSISASLAAASLPPQFLDTSTREITAGDLDNLMARIGDSAVLHGLNSNRRLHATIVNFHKTFKESNFDQFNPMLIECTGRIRKQAQKMNIVAKDHKGKVQVRYCWAKFLMAYANDDRVQLELYLHQMMFLIFTIYGNT